MPLCRAHIFSFASLLRVSFTKRIQYKDVDTWQMTVTRKLFQERVLKCFGRQTGPQCQEHAMLLQMPGTPMRIWYVD